MKKLLLLLLLSAIPSFGAWTATLPDKCIRDDASMKCLVVFSDGVSKPLRRELTIDSAADFEIKFKALVKEQIRQLEAIDSAIGKIATGAISVPADPPVVVDADLAPFIEALKAYAYAKVEVDTGTVKTTTKLDAAKAAFDTLYAVDIVKHPEYVVYLAQIPK